MLLKSSSSLLLLALVAAPGCAADSTSEATAPAEIAEESGALRELASIEKKQGTVSFQAAEGEEGVSVFIQESGDIGTQLPVSMLVEEHGPLTSLEIFRALTDVPAPQELVDAHADEALLLEREDNGVRDVEFDEDALVLKSSASCDHSAYPPADGFWLYPNKLRVDQYGSTPWVPVGTSLSDWGFRTFRTVTMAVCNESNSTIQSQLAWDPGPGWQYSTRYDLPAGQTHVWWDRSLGGNNLTRYGVRAIASSTKYVRVRTSNMQRVVR